MLLVHSSLNTSVHSNHLLKSIPCFLHAAVQIRLSVAVTARKLGLLGLLGYNYKNLLASIKVHLYAATKDRPAVLAMYCCSLLR